MVAVSLPTSSPLLPPLPHPASSHSTRSQFQLSFPRTPTPSRLQAGSTSRRRLSVVRAAEEKGASTANGEQGGFSILNLPDWAKWALGASVWLTLPLANKLRDFGNLVARVDSVVEKVEEVAEKADKIAEDLAQDLPEGSLKQLAVKVEKTSEVVATRAKVLDDILDKMSAFVADMMNTGSKDTASGAAPPAGGQDRKGSAGAAAATSSSASTEDKGKPR